MAKQTIDARVDDEKKTALFSRKNRRYARYWGGGRSACYVIPDLSYYKGELENMLPKRIGGMETRRLYIIILREVDQRVYTAAYTTCQDRRSNPNFEQISIECTVD